MPFTKIILLLDETSFAKQNPQHDPRCILTGNSQMLANVGVVKLKKFMIACRSCLAKYQGHIR